MQGGMGSFLGLKKAKDHFSIMGEVFKNRKLLRECRLIEVSGAWAKGWAFSFW